MQRRRSSDALHDACMWSVINADFVPPYASGMPTPTRLDMPGASFYLLHIAMHTTRLITDDCCAIEISGSDLLR